MTNWYKIAAGTTDQLAADIARLLVDVYYGTSQKSLDEVKNVAVAMFDIEALNSAINKGELIALQTTGQDMLIPEQEQIISALRGSFREMSQSTEKLQVPPDEMKQMMNPENLSNDNVISDSEEIGFIQQ